MMVRALKLVIPALIISFVGYFTAVKEDIIFGYSIAYPYFWNVIFLVLWAIFVSVYYQVTEYINIARAPYERLMRNRLIAFAVGFVFFFLILLIKFSNKEMASFTETLLVVTGIESLIFGLIYSSNLDEDNDSVFGSFNLFILSFSGIIAIGFFRNIIPFFIVVLIPYFLISGLALFWRACFEKRNIIVDFGRWLVSK